MAKDPAILWYYNDYLSGTEHMTFEEQGAYMRLLCKQADIGHMNLDFIKKVLGKSFKKIWQNISEKFLQDEKGDFFNARVDAEKNKRKKYSETQAQRVKDYWDKKNKDGGSVEAWNSQPSGLVIPIKDIPLENRNENESQKENVVNEMNRVFLQHFPKYFQEKENDFPALREIAYRIATMLKISKADAIGEKRPVIVRRWGEILDFVATSAWYSAKSISDLNKHFQALMQAYEVYKPATASINEAEEINRARDQKNAKIKAKYSL